MTCLRTCLSLCLLVACAGDKEPDGDTATPSEEVCNGKDDDGDGEVDEGLRSLWYRDLDGDGYGQDAQATEACAAPEGYADRGGDCNDTDDTVHPDADEHCDGVDEDCDGDIDEEPVDQGAWFADLDGDGYGDPGSPSTECSAPEGYVSNELDCDDGDDTVHPGAIEVCDGVDQDCDPATDEGGLAAFLSEGGIAEDWSDRLGAGSADEPAVIVVTEAGSLTICPGDYAVAFRVRANLSILGQTGVPEDVRLDAHGAQGVIIVRTEGVSLNLEAITLTGGEGAGAILGEYTAGGGLECDGAGPVRLDGVVITDNHAGVGGGIFARDCGLDLVDVRVEDNRADYYGGGIFLADGSLTASASAVTDNQADYGGAIAAVSLGTATTADLDATVVSDNQAIRQGGGLILEDAELTCLDGAVTGNSAHTGGGAFLDGAATLDSQSCSWGTAAGGDNNAPDDVSDLDYGDAATFSCDREGCQ